MFNVKKVACAISFSLLVCLFIYLVILTRDSKNIIEVKDFIKSDIKVLYVHKDREQKYVLDILKKYSIEHMSIDSNKLTVFEKKKLKTIVD